jgi:D-xylulose reductase
MCQHGRYEVSFRANMIGLSKASPQLCPDIIFAATPPYDGTLGRYYSLPAHLAHPLPDNISLEEGAMVSRAFIQYDANPDVFCKMEPLSVGIHSVYNLGGLRTNQSIVVFGCGPVGSCIWALIAHVSRIDEKLAGLLCMAVAKALGASRIIAVDIVPSRLEFARKYAATAVYQPPSPLEGETKVEFAERNIANMKKEVGIENIGERAIDLVIDARYSFYGIHVPCQTVIVFKVVQKSPSRRGFVS